MRLRIAAGILLGVLMLLLYVTFSGGTFFFGGLPDRPPLVNLYPWLKYPFLAVLCATVFVWFILWKKEGGVVRNGELKETRRLGLIVRILSGLLGLTLFIIATDYSISVWLSGNFTRWWINTILVGGYAIVFLWIAISGRKPFSSSATAKQKDSGDQ
jgi:hypothetical protein